MAQILHVQEFYTLGSDGPEIRYSSFLRPPRHGHDAGGFDILQMLFEASRPALRGDQFLGGIDILLEFA
jgi:hypothetical protein